MFLKISVDIFQQIIKVVCMKKPLEVIVYKVGIFRIQYFRCWRFLPLLDMRISARFIQVGPWEISW